MANEPDIVIKEVLGDKRIAFRGLDSLDISEQDNENWVEDYEDALIELSNVEEEGYQGAELAWNAGRAVDMAGDEAKMAKLVRHSEIDIADPYTLQRYYNFYKMFNDGDYDPDYPVSVYTELAVAERSDAGRNALSNLNDADIIPRVYEVRAWAKCYEENDFSLHNAVKYLIRESRTQTDGLDSQQLIQGVSRIFLMAGDGDRQVDRDEVKEIVTSLQS